MTTGQSDAHFAAFARLAATHTMYNDYDMPAFTRVFDGDSTDVLTTTHYRFNTVGRLQCVTVQMNPAAAPPSCGAGTAGAFGPNRLTGIAYDAAGQVTLTRVTAGAGTQADTVSTYSPNGQTLTVTDPRGFRTTYEYDGHDRLAKVRYPHPSATGTSSTTDEEQYTYDAAGNVATYRTRAGATFSYAYDNLGRRTGVTAPSLDPATATAYDFRGSRQYTTEFVAVGAPYRKFGAPA